MRRIAIARGQALNQVLRGRNAALFKCLQALRAEAPDLGQLAHPHAPFRRGVNH